tara:strand:- start:339 stop:500 length:162 start_codon:yes stop_codon:yes gene_type:complete
MLVAVAVAAAASVVVQPSCWVVLDHHVVAVAVAADASLDLLREEDLFQRVASS